MKGTNEELGKKMLAEVRPAHHRCRHHGRSRDQDRRRRQVSPGQNTNMSIYINKDTKVITQGITGKTGQFHTLGCREYANGKELLRRGREPQEGGREVLDIPIYGTVKEAAAQQTGATVSVIYVPPAGAAAAIWEAVEADLDLAICITEGIPVRDMLEVRNKMKAKELLAARRRCCWAPTAPASSRLTRSRSASCPATSTARAASAWSRARHADVRSRGTAVRAGMGQSSPWALVATPSTAWKHIDVMRAFNDDPGHRCRDHDRRNRRPGRSRSRPWCKAT